MARPLRVEYPGAYYHVINRGNACKGLGAFSDGISGAAITRKYNQMHAELMRNNERMGVKEDGGHTLISD